MAVRTNYRRIIVSLGPGRIDRQAIRAAATFARLLKLEMVGVFVEDESVLGLSGLPFVRELRLPGQAWHAFDPARVAEELSVAAQQARRLLDEEATACGAACQFEVRRGNPATLVSELGRLDDILVVGDPTEATGWLSSSTARARQSAFVSPASILFLPSTVEARVGPIAAVAQALSDPAAAVARRIAQAAREELVLVPSDDKTAVGLEASLNRVLGLRHERITVMAREVRVSSIEMVATLVARRNAPVLLVEPTAARSDPASAD